jgi:hypothetical protein
MPTRSSPNARVTLLLAVGTGAWGCFASPPTVDDGVTLGDEASTGDEGSSSGTAADGTDADADTRTSEPAASSEDDSSGGGEICADESPPEGCVEALVNGGFDEWDMRLPAPTSWGVTEGELGRASDDASECTPAMTLSAGAPAQDGVVWRLVQDIPDVEIPAGGHATFLARMDRIAGPVGMPRLCFDADPAPICDPVLGLDDSGWVTISVDMPADDGPIMLQAFALSSTEPGQVVAIDDLHLWVCTE